MRNIYLLFTLAYICIFTACEVNPPEVLTIPFETVFEKYVNTGDAQLLDISLFTEIEPESVCWIVTDHPIGNNYSLRSLSLTEVEFTMKNPGPYKVQATIESPFVKEQYEFVFHAFDLLLEAHAGEDRNQEAGIPITLDGSGSFNAQDKPLTYNWEIVEKPWNSRLTLDTPGLAQLSFLPDANGIYTFSLTVNNGEVTSTPDLVSYHIWNKAELIQGDVFDAEYSDALDSVVFLTDAPSHSLVVYPLEGYAKRVNLPLKGLSVSVSPDGCFAAVGSDGYIFYVDLIKGEIVKDIIFSALVRDLALGADNTLYVRHGRGSYNTAFVKIDLIQNTETEMPLEPLDPVPDKIKLHPDGQRILATTYNNSFDGLAEYRLSGDSITSAVDVKDKEYSDPSGLWLSEDGSKVFLSTGSSFTSDSLLYSGDLSEVYTFNGVAHSQEKDMVIALNYTSYSGDDYDVLFYESEYLSYRGKFRLPQLNFQGEEMKTAGRFIFFSSDGSKFIVLASLYRDYFYSFNTSDKFALISYNL